MSTDDEKEYKCESENCDMEATKWVLERMNNWGDEMITGPFWAGVAKAKCTNKKRDESSENREHLIMPDLRRRDRDRELQ